MSSRQPTDYSRGLLGALSRTPDPATELTGLVNALLPPTPGRYGLGALGGLTTPPPPSAFSLASLLSTPPTPKPSLGELLYPHLSAPIPKAKTKRRVFYSFHFADIMRVNVVRRCSQFQPEDGVFDNSLWERTKLKGDPALKRLIADGLYNSSVTCVLAGAQTYGRPWVRYEIALSLFRGNGLLVAFIDDVPCAHNRPAIRGPNPAAQMAVGRLANGDNRVYEYTAAGWTLYAAMTSPIAWPKWLPKTADIHHVMPLGEYVGRYAFHTQDGYKNIASWADAAAIKAGRV